MHILFLPAQKALLKGKDTSFTLREQSMDLLRDICKDHTILVAFTDPWLDSIMCDPTDPMFKTKKMLFDAIVERRIPLCANYKDIAVRGQLKIDPETDPRYKDHLLKFPKGTWIQVCTNGQMVTASPRGTEYMEKHTIYISPVWGLSKASANRINEILYKYEEENQE